MKKVGKLIAYLLIATTIFTLSQPALSAKAGEETYNFIGSNETILASSNEIQRMSINSEPEIVITYVEGKDGTHQIFTYRDGELVEIVHGGIGVTEVKSQTRIIQQTN